MDSITPTKGTYFITLRRIVCSAIAARSKFSGYCAIACRLARAVATKRWGWETMAGLASSMDRLMQLQSASLEHSLAVCSTKTCWKGCHALVRAGLLVPSCTFSSIWPFPDHNNLLVAELLVTNLLVAELLAVHLVPWISADSVTDSKYLLVSDPLAGNPVASPK